MSSSVLGWGVQGYDFVGLQDRKEESRLIVMGPMRGGKGGV